MSLQGAYEREEGDPDAVSIQITHGYSRDHRPDLKQFSLVMSDKLPVFIQALSGNTSDKDRRERIWAVIAGEVGRSQDMGLEQCGIFGEESARDFRELQVDNEVSRNVIRSERSAGKRGRGKDEKHFSQWLLPLQYRGGIRRRDGGWLHSRRRRLKERRRRWKIR